MAGAAPEGSQFDARQFDQKLNDVLEGGDEFFTSYDEVYESFDSMGLQENLLRGIYAYGFEKPSAIQQRGIEKPNEEKEEIEKPNEEKEETMNIRVKQISEKPDRIAPIVAYFASGYDPSDKFDGDGDGDGHCSDVEVYRHKAGTKSKRLQVVVSPPGSSVKFVGSNYTGEGATGQTCVYTLGVLDKEKQTLKILPIASNKIFRLEPRVKNAESVDSEASLGGVSTELTAAERAVKARKLNNLYGTKSAINRDKKMRALNPGDDPESQQHLEGKLNEMEIKKEALESTDSIISRNIPPCDVSAATPREAYPLDQIILKGEWGFLEDIYSHLQQGTGAAPDTYPVFVRNRIYKLRDIKDETEKKTMSCILSFITHLVKFKDVKSMNGYNSAKDHRFPGVIQQRFKSMFRDPESDRIPTDKINLLTSYVLVLTLHVDEFKTSVEDIAKDLRMSSIDLRKHYEHLGCKCSRVKTVLHATLPVPLKFPQAMRKKRRR